MATHSRIFYAGLALAFSLALPLAANEGQPADGPLVEAYLLKGQLDAAEKAIAEHLKSHAGDQQAQFSLGVVQLLRGVERFSQAAHKHGLNSSAAGAKFLPLPIAKNPSPASINYEQSRQIVQKLVEDMQRAEQTLAQVDTSKEVKLPLQLGQIRLDLNGDGQADDTETLAQVYVQHKLNIGGVGPPAGLPPEDIDAAMGQDSIEPDGDAIVAPPGLEGDAPPTSAPAPKPADQPETPVNPAVPEIGAVDDLFEPNNAGQAVPEIGAVGTSDLPVAEVAPPSAVPSVHETNDTGPQLASDDPAIDGATPVDAIGLPSAVQSREQLEAQANEFTVTLDAADVHWLRGCCHLLQGLGNSYLAHDTQTLFNQTAHLVFPNAHTPYPFLKKSAEKTPPPDAKDTFPLIDWVAAVHLVRLDVVEPKRLSAARGHLLSAIEQNRQAWQRIAAETDNHGELIPSPRQSAVIVDMKLHQLNIDAWLTALAEWDALLKGERLAPFWRGETGEGVNVKRVFEEPRPLDLVLWVQGTAAVPYLEKGTLGDKAIWQRLPAMFSETFIRTAMLRD